MQEIQRYTIWHYEQKEADAEGEWVRFEDVESQQAELERLRGALKLAKPILDDELQSLCGSFCVPCKTGETFDYTGLKEPELGWITRCEAALDAVDAALNPPAAAESGDGK